MAHNTLPKKRLVSRVKRVSMLLILLAIGFAAAGGIYTFNKPIAKAERTKTISSQIEQSKPVQKQAHIGIPVRLQISDILLDVPIEPGAYDPATEDWSIGTSVAQYAKETPPANDSAGTTLLYGHNNKKVFMPLFSVKTGSLAVVTTDDGQKFTYRYESQNELLPTDTQAIKNTVAPTLVMLTCSGENFTIRTLFHFSFVKWEAA